MRDTEVWKQLTDNLKLFETEETDIMNVSWSFMTIEWDRTKVVCWNWNHKPKYVVEDHLVRYFYTSVASDVFEEPLLFLI